MATTPPAAPPAMGPMVELDLVSFSVTLYGSTAEVAAVEKLLLGFELLSGVVVAVASVIGAKLRLV